MDGAVTDTSLLRISITTSVFIPSSNRLSSLSISIRTGKVVTFCSTLAKGSTFETVPKNSLSLYAATLIDTTLTLPKKSQTEVISIDEYVENLKLTFVHFIKCDVEGLELEVLRGGLNTLKTLKPKVSLEITLAENDLKEAIHLLRSAGYSNFNKIEKDYPLFDINMHNYSEDYFYLYASC